MSQKEKEKEFGNSPESYVLESLAKKDENIKKEKKHKKENESKSNKKDNNKKMTRKRKIKKFVISLFIAKPEKEIKEEKDSFSRSSNMSIPI